MAAERGGAQRIEFCSNTKEGGTTPSPELMRAVRDRVRIPIVSMIRPRGGNFVYSDAEFAAMQREIETAKNLRMDGIVLGLLKADGQIDIERTKQLVARARPLEVTFHRAFDECADLRRSLEDVMKAGATRLLTSGGKQTAPEALEVLGESRSNRREEIDCDARQRAARGEYSSGRREDRRTRIPRRIEFRDCISCEEPERFRGRSKKTCGCATRM